MYMNATYFLFLGIFTIYTSTNHSVIDENLIFDSQWDRATHIMEKQCSSFMWAYSGKDNRFANMIKKIRGPVNKHMYWIVVCNHSATVVGLFQNNSNLTKEKLICICKTTWKSSSIPRLAWT